MDDERIRAQLPVALALLYSELHAVVGLDVDADAGFDKFNARDRVQRKYFIFSEWVRQSRAFGRIESVLY